VQCSKQPGTAGAEDQDIGFETFEVHAILKARAREI
jgi:hypothetical protein